MAARFASEKGVEVLLDAMPAILKKYPEGASLVRRDISKRNGRASLLRPAHAAHP
jgi:hypothetical protein